MGSAFLSIPDFQEYTIKITYLDIKQCFATKSNVFQTRISITKAFTCIQGVDKLNQSNFTVRPLQQFTVYNGSEFKMKFLCQLLYFLRHIFYQAIIRQNFCNTRIMQGGKRNISIPTATAGLPAIGSNGLTRCGPRKTPFGLSGMICGGR